MYPKEKKTKVGCAAQRPQKIESTKLDRSSNDMCTIKDKNKFLTQNLCRQEIVIAYRSPICGIRDTTQIHYMCGQNWRMQRLSKKQMKYKIHPKQPSLSGLTRFCRGVLSRSFSSLPFNIFGSCISCVMIVAPKWKRRISLGILGLPYCVNCSVDTVATQRN